ncbi:Beta-glucosidase B [Lachnellula occidentalis]|uniref:beta-glucosidase n=1 Tax=Lachnellula occidentalis TaxID=215460 RepID=A0A8H8RSZ1_9HELO|nr:Beta-glucosidase B [Lachnellula occidentalis]
MATLSNSKRLLVELTLQEKISLLSGADGWQTQEIPRLGIGSLKVRSIPSTERLSHGPAGARGALSTDGPAAAFLPAPVALAATWSNNDLYAIGKLLCREAKTKAAQVLLAPTICCARNPLGGRNFESYSEDPHLSGTLAIEYIRGVQESGEVAATVKHFVANEQEYQRFTINAEIGERALHEIYLRPFEMAVKSENPPKCVMTAYNCVNGSHMDMCNKLIRETLRGDWGFQGLVMSDWGGTNSTVQSVLAGCDLEMPGPAEKRGKFLLKEMVENPTEELSAAIDASCLRVLDLLQHSKLLGLSPEEAQKTRSRPETSSDVKEHQSLLRRVAANSIVLLRNSSNLLPLTPSRLQGKRIAFIGPNALHGTPGGGGSATMNPQYQTQPLAAFKSIISELGIDVEVNHSPGSFIHKWLPLLDSDQWSLASEDSSGETKNILKLDFFATGDFSGEVVETQYRNSSLLDLFDSAPSFYYEDHNLHSLRVRSQVTPRTTGKHSFGICSVGNARLFVDGKLLIDNYDWKQVGETFYSFGSVEASASMEMVAGKKYQVLVEASTREIPFGSTTSDDPIHVFGVQPSVRLGFIEQLPENPITDAVELANRSDITILIIGLNDEWESEGYDRQSMKLPGTQDELVTQLLGSAEHPENIVIINQSGSPVEMDWADDANTIVQAWYGGQEAGNALCDILLGRISPEGRLPITWPRSYSDLPFEKNPETWPGVDGNVVYKEGIFVGYRWYLKNQVAPRWWFGYGLGYTTFEFSDLKIVRLDDRWDISTLVTNTGDHDGREVVQCYSWPLESDAQELRAFGKTSTLTPGQSETISLSINLRDLAHWDIGSQKWALEKGFYNLGIAKCASDKNILQSKVEV